MCTSCKVYQARVTFMTFLLKDSFLTASCAVVVPETHKLLLLRNFLKFVWYFVIVLVFLVGFMWVSCVLVVFYLCFLVFYLFQALVLAVSTENDFQSCFCLKFLLFKPLLLLYSKQI